MLRRLLALWMLPALAPAAMGADLLPADRPISEVVDHYIDTAIRSAKIKHAPPADDATFLRRVTLDLAGRVPTLGEVETYLADSDPERKQKLIERLLASSSYKRHQAQELLSFLKVQEPGRRNPKSSPLQEYLTNAVAENRPWDRMFRELLLPDESDSKLKGASEFLKSRVKDQTRLTIDVSTIFFGVNVSCAQCHDHPHVHAWTQDHFYGMKSFFARTIDNGGFLAERDFGAVKYVPNKGQEKVAPVMFLTGKAIDVPGLGDAPREEKQKEQKRLDEAKKAKKQPDPPQFSLRAKLVETALEQRDFFARAIVNRTWHRFFGRGLVMPLDQMHLENPASHPELLEWLARDLVNHGYDLRRLIHGLVSSNAYARSSRWEGDDVPQDKYFAVAQVRPLKPTQMATSLKLATTDPRSLSASDLEKQLEDLASRAEKFAGSFAQPDDDFQVSVTEAMLFANNEALVKDLLEGTGTLTKRLMEINDLEKRADLAVRTILGREPRMDEVRLLADYQARRTDRAEEACRQIIWALVTSAEFRFNH